MFLCAARRGVCSSVLGEVSVLMYLLDDILSFVWFTAGQPHRSGPE